MQYTLASIELWKRRARIGVMGIGAVAVVSLVAMTVPMLDRDGAIASAVAQAVADPGSVLSARSPGGRPAGALTQSKKKKRVASIARKKPRVPTERVLSQIRERPGAFPDEYLPLGPDPFEGLAVPPVALAQAAPVVPAIPGVPVIALDPGNGFGPGPIGGFPGGGVIGDPGGDVDNPPPPPPPASGVPEPGTWATFILGFFFVGHAIRRRRPRGQRKAS